MTQKAENVPIIRWWDHWIALMMLSAITMVGGRLWVTEWTSNLDILVYLSFFAAVAGLSLGYSRFSPLVSALFSTIFGIFFIGWLFGTTVEIEMAWQNRIFNYLGWRLRIAIEQFIAGETVTNPILFLTIMAILLWILGTSTAFILIRKGVVWPSIIPLGLNLLVIGHYDPNLLRNMRFLMTFLFFTLLILGRMTFLRYRQKWRQEGIHTTTEIQTDLNKTLLILAAAMLLFTWIIPVTPQQVTRYSDLWERITEPWDRLSEKFSDILVITTTTTSSSTGYFGDSMGLGSGSPTSEDIVFTVTGGSESPTGYRNYWRARSYDFYFNDSWASSPGLSDILLFPGNFDIRYPEWEDGQTARYTFTTHVDPTINLYAPGLPTWVSRPAEASIHPLSDTEADLIAMIADPELTAEETYQVETIVRLPTQNALRNTRSEYPGWLDRYLQLPTNFSPEVMALAVEISRVFNNPYDKTVAITRYLRDNIEYSRTIPPIPAGADPIAWFLFQEKSGFCNYYATAQVLMLRSLGIPARIAVGYAEGKFDFQTETYTVRKRDSHAWPEVYFMEFGWVTFEPTVSQPSISLPVGSQPLDEFSDLVRPEGNKPLMDLPLGDLDLPIENIPENDIGGSEAEPDQSLFHIRMSSLVWVILTIFLAVLLIFIFSYFRLINFKINIEPFPILVENALTKRGKSVPNWLRRWSTFARMSVVEKAYLQLGRSIKIMGQPVNLAETPSERALTLIALLPTANQPAQDIVSEYHLDVFSDHIINEERAKNAARLVRSLALKARFRKIFKFAKRN